MGRPCLPAAASTPRKASRRLRRLDDGRAGQDLCVGDRLGLGDHHVHLALEVLRHDAVAARDGCELGATTARPLALVHPSRIDTRKHLRSDKGAELRAGRVRGVGELEVGPHGGLLGVLQRDAGERLDVEVGALRARGDELRGEGEDGAGAERGVEGGGDGFGARRGADEGLVAGFDGDDGRRRGEHVRRVDQGRGAEVGGDADSFEDARRGDHGLCVLERRVEVVRAGLDGLCAGTSDGRLERGYVRGFGLANVHQGLDLGFGEAEGGEVAHGELLEALGVEGRLEVLCSEGTGVG